MKKYLDIKGLREKLGGRSRASVYLDVAIRVLPKPLKLQGLNYWSDSEVDEALERERQRQEAKRNRPGPEAA